MTTTDDRRNAVAVVRSRLSYSIASVVCTYKYGRLKKP